jgi:hypothetical protein
MIGVIAKKYEVEKAIILALVQYEFLSYNKLKLLEGMSKYGTETLRKYLGELSEEGAIQIEQKITGRKETKIWLDPYDRTVIKQLIETMEKSGKATGELVGQCNRLLDFGKDPSKHDKISAEIEIIFHDLLNMYFTKWFESYFYVIFISTAGTIPAAMGKYLMINYRLQLDMTGKLLRKVKKVYPDTYDLFLHYASGRLRIPF